MLNKQEHIEARDYVLRMLPQVLHQDPAYATTLKDIMIEHSPPSASASLDILAGMLDEIVEGIRIYRYSDKANQYNSSPKQTKPLK